MGELGRDWLRGVGVTVPVTGGGGGGWENSHAWPLCWPLVSLGTLLSPAHIPGQRSQGHVLHHDSHGRLNNHTKHSHDVRMLQLLQRGGLMQQAPSIHWHSAQGR
jgi:hypothetical protein